MIAECSRVILKAMSLKLDSLLYYTPSVACHYQKSDNKAGWVLARTFLIVYRGSLSSQLDWVEKEVLHASFVYKNVYHIERFFCRCLINHTVFWCYMRKGCATATLRGTLALRLQMSGEKSNGSS